MSSESAVTNHATGRHPRLRLRTRVETFKGSDVWDEVQIVKTFPVAETAILLCDLWDDHPCVPAAQRVGAMVPRVNAVLARARGNGVQIVHAPSETMDFYADTPFRRRILDVPRVAPPDSLMLDMPPLPIDTSRGSCDGELKNDNKRNWTRQHPGIVIAGDDVISDDGVEVYSFFQHKGIRNLLIMGVHTNFCILKRTFAIIQMTKWGVRCALIRDLTDALYDPKTSPYVSHDEGTELVVQHIEKYWCPSVVSDDLMRVEQ